MKHNIVVELKKEVDAEIRINIFFNLVMKNKIDIQSLEEIILKEKLLDVGELRQILYCNTYFFDKLYSLIANCNSCGLIQWFGNCSYKVGCFESAINLYKSCLELDNNIALLSIVKFYNKVQTYNTHQVKENYNTSIHKQDSIQYSEKLLKLHNDSKHGIICLIRNKYECQKEPNCNNCNEAIRLCDEAINLGKYSLYKIKKNLYKNCKCCKDINKAIECAYKYVQKTKKKVFLSDIANGIMDRYIKLEEKYEKLKIHLDYKPGGDGYLEAFNHFNTNKDKL